MRKSLFTLLMSFPLLAGAADPAFDAGASFGKGSASSGTDTLKNPGTVTSAIPGYTANPPEKGYYGGVSGGDGGLANKGQAALQGNDAAQSVISSGTTNPAPAIDPKAPLSPSARMRRARLTGSWMAAASSVHRRPCQNRRLITIPVAPMWLYQRPVPATHKLPAIMRIRCPRKLWSSRRRRWSLRKSMTTRLDLRCRWMNRGHHAGRFNHHIAKSSAGNPFFSSKLTFYGTSKTLKNVNNTFDVDVAQQVVPADGMLRGTLTNDVSDYIDQMMMSVMSSKYPNNDGLAKITATITIVTTVKVWVPSTTTPSVCPDSPGGKKTGSVCTIKGGDRQVVVDGVTQTVHSDCWQYTDTYLVSENTTGTCASLTSNAACTKASETCSEYIDGTCSHKDYIYQCQTVHSSTGLVCGGQYICKSGDCDDTNGAGDNGFDTAVAKLAGLASAAEDVRDQNSTINVRAFTGKAMMSCRKALRDSLTVVRTLAGDRTPDWRPVTMMRWPSARRKPRRSPSVWVTAAIVRCRRMLQKSQVYCVFDGKLARIIQEQGRRDQLGVKFGSGRQS
jgi:conjugal transfer mating pair stabilization protein TraN